MVLRSTFRSGLWALMLVASAQAFDSPEHERLANLAYHLAMRIECPDAATDNPSCAVFRAAFADPLDARRRSAKSPALTYGTIVQCVDYFLTPEKMLAGREDELFGGVLTKPEVLTSVVPRSADDFRGIDFSVHCRDSIANVAETQAAHSNHAHFQAELIASQNLYHRLAMGLRRDKKLFGALFVNAISDHYLHDFFAPGHIVTFRSHMSDIYSNALHDSVNASGARLRFPSGKYAELLTSLLPSPAPSRGLVEYGLDPTERRTFRCAARRKPLERLMRPDAADVCVVDDGTPPVPADLDAAENLDALLRGAVGADDTKPTSQVFVLGDGALWRPAQRPQRALMLALQIRSILDVLRADSAGSVNWFDNGRWSSNRLADDGGALITASLDGDFEFRFRFLTDALREQYKEGAFKVEEGQDVVAIAALGRRALQLLPQGAHEIVLSAGFNYEMPRFGGRQGRASVSFETPVLAYLTTGASKLNYGVTVGAFGFTEQGQWHGGLSLRPGVVLTQSETFVSVPLRWFHFPAGDGDAASWRSSWGIRVDQGFSSFVTVYLQYTNGPFRQEGGRFDRGPVYGAGFVLAAPLCRIPGVGGVFCK